MGAIANCRFHNIPYNWLTLVLDAAWGSILDTSGTLATTLGKYNPLRYRGYVYDRETGLYYLQSRYYNPDVGRFINADGYISTGQGLTGYNMFAYCGNPECIYRSNAWCDNDNNRST